MQNLSASLKNTARAPALGNLTLVVVALAAILSTARAQAADANTPFTGDKSQWHGFDRYDFLLDASTFSINPAADNTTPPGQRRCIVVVPKAPAAGNPWSWRGCYWDHQPQTEIELLRRGFHIAYITADANLKPDKKWDAWYSFLVEQHGLSKKPAFIGMSRGGEYAYTWSVRNPGKVSCIYADNPGCNAEVFAGLGELAKNDVPILQICGSIDPLLGENALAIENIYQQFGGRVSMMIKDGYGHHPHSLIDPKPIADFITQSVNASEAKAPAYAGERFTRTSYYSNAADFREFPEQKTFVTCRGPMFVECYNRYMFGLPKVEGSITVIEPNKPAAGNPWVFRADMDNRDAQVDLALLAKGFYIVTGPVPYNADGPIREQWNAVYKHLTDAGFSKKVVMEGSGGAAGEAYAWAIDNADKVACIYAENPLLTSRVSKVQPLENLAPLAKAGVPIMHLCGSLDPWLESNTRAAEKRYKDLGGKITVIVKNGEGHTLSPSTDPKPAVDFIMASVSSK